MDEDMREDIRRYRDIRGFEAAWELRSGEDRVMAWTRKPKENNKAGQKRSASLFGKEAENWLRKRWDRAVDKRKASVKRMRRMCLAQRESGLEFGGLPADMRFQTALSDYFSAGDSLQELLLMSSAEMARHAADARRTRLRRAAKRKEQNAMKQAATQTAGTGGHDAASD